MCHRDAKCLCGLLVEAGNLLTNMERVRRDIATSEECGCCARFPESDLHVL